MNSASRLRIFATCEISQPANFHRLRKFSKPEKSSGKFFSPKTEHLQQHKPKNYKLSLKNKKIHKIWKSKVINENPNLKIEIKQNKNLTKIWSGFQVLAGTTPCDADKRSHGGPRRRSSSMLAVRCAAVESNFCSCLLSIMLSGGVDGMTDAG